MILYFASTNQGKLQEFREGAREHDILVQPVPRIDELSPCVEDGSTFEQNAIKKAVHYSAYVEDPVFADDSGLCVDALGGAPGVYSARFASIEGDSVSCSPIETGAAKVSGTWSRRRDYRPALSGVSADRIGIGDLDSANNAKLLRKIEGIPDDQLTAHYVCAIALAHTELTLKVTEGKVHGLIIRTPRGNGGFGYDPYFLFLPLGQTFAELRPDQKFAVSHRGEAFRKLLHYLQR